MPLFKTDLSSILRQSHDKAFAEIDKLPNEVVMANDLEILCNNIFEGQKIFPVNVLAEDVSRRELNQTKVTRLILPVEPWEHEPKKTTVAGLCLRSYFPFEGNEMLFECREVSIELFPPADVVIKDSFVVVERQYDIKTVQREGWKEELERTLLNDLSRCRSALSCVNQSVNNFNNSLRAEIMEELRGKKEAIECFYQTAKRIDVSVHKNEYGTRNIAVVRRIVPIAHKFAPQEVSYSISDANYEDILGVIKHTTATMERTPRSYRFSGEEDLRNFLLASLNGTYQGAATGEAFRKNGKTDICIEAQNRAAFVAECKMWTGENKIESALHQLDNYLTWRDIKAALIYFVRRKNFLGIIEKVRGRLAAIQNITMVRQMNGQNEFECSMASTSTPGQRMTIRVLLVNMGTGKEQTE